MNIKDKVNKLVYIRSNKLFDSNYKPCYITHYNEETGEISYITNAYGTNSLYTNKENTSNLSFVDIADKDKILEALNIDRLYEKRNLENKLKPLSRDVYQTELNQRYNEIKNRIKSVCSNILSDTGIDEMVNFENRVKELYQLHKQLFNIECEEVIEARKINGTVKYELRELNKAYDKMIKDLDIGELSEKLGIKGSVTENSVTKETE